MKLPKPPPNIQEIWARLAHHEPERLVQITLTPPPHEYLHWDQLRRRTPPSGLTPDEWWLSVALVRRRTATTLPLHDRSGRPLWFVPSHPIQRTLSRMDRQLAGLLESTSRSHPEQERTRYVLNATMEEAIASSQLEGAETTRRDAKRMLRAGRPPKDHDERMIWNNYRALRYVAEHRDAPWTKTRILELHRLATLDTLRDSADEGRVRTVDDVRVTEPSTGEILHIPPHSDELPARLERLIEFANDMEDRDPFVHPVMKAIAIHYQIGHDHPFVDGNGRTARAMATWYLLKRGYWLAEFLALSRIIKRAPVQYAMAYQYVQSDNNDLTYFATHQLNALDKSIDALQHWRSQRQGKVEDARKVLRRFPGINARQAALVDHALRHPDAVYDIATHQAFHTVTYPTARADLLDLVGRGLLEQQKSGRKLIFFADERLMDHVNDRL